MHCHDMASFIARRADDPEALDRDTRAAIDAHLETCASCRADFETQSAVAAWLRTRPADPLSREFEARLASRLDEASGWFGIADWRTWTLRLAPVAAALAVATYLGLGSPAPSATTLEDWTLGAPESSTASVLWESDVSPESVMESMLTGERPATGGEGSNVR
jgi:anti-sigma factor RsiW